MTSNTLSNNINNGLEISIPKNKQSSKNSLSESSNEETRFAICPKCKKKCMYYSKGKPKEHIHIGCGGMIFL